jgi:hypothetical protein
MVRLRVSLAQLPPRATAGRRSYRQVMAGVSVIGAACCMVGLATAATGCSTMTADASPPARCAAKASAQVRPNAWGPAMRQLAPPGATAIRLCRYSGLNGPHPLHLARSVTAPRGRLVRLLVREFDRLPRFAPGAIACPMDDGSQVVALLSYPGGHSVSISVGLTGCTRVTNGDVVRTALGIGPSPRSGPSLLEHLERLTRHRTRHR